MDFADVETYFQANSRRFADLAWDDPHQLSPAQKRTVSAALQLLERGAGAGGERLRALAGQVPEADYAAALRHGIEEKQGHADILGRFMDRQGIPRLAAHWLPGIFRLLGRRLGLAHLVRVLLTAEVVTTVYYRALFNATFSGLLQQICRRLLLDEEIHLLCHCLAIRQLSPRRRGLSAWFWQQFYRGFMTGAALVAYLLGRRTLRAGGYGLVSFCTAIATEYARAEQLQRATPPLTAESASPAGAWQWPGQHLRVAR